MNPISNLYNKIREWNAATGRSKIGARDAAIEAVSAIDYIEYPPPAVWEIDSCMGRIESGEAAAALLHAKAALQLMNESDIPPSVMEVEFTHEEKPAMRHWRFADGLRAATTTFVLEGPPQVAFCMDPSLEDNAGKWNWDRGFILNGRETVQQTLRRLRPLALVVYNRRRLAAFVDERFAAGKVLLARGDTITDIARLLARHDRMVTDGEMQKWERLTFLQWETELASTLPPILEEAG